MTIRTVTSISALFEHASQHRLAADKLEQDRTVKGVEAEIERRKAQDIYEAAEMMMAEIAHMPCGICNDRIAAPYNGAEPVHLRTGSVKCAPAAPNEPQHAPVEQAPA